MGNFSEQLWGDSHERDQRFYVSAEVQLEQRLHEVYDAWAFTPICREADR